MTDQAPPAGAPQAEAPAAQMQILAQYIKDLSFENPNTPGIFTNPGSGQPQIKVNVDVKTNQAGENRFEVVLNIKAEGERDGKATFLVELSYGGLVQFAADTPKQQIGVILLVQVPTLLFPAARNIIADCTRDGGFPPLLVQPVDFFSMFRRQMEALKAAQQGDAGAAAPVPTAGPLSDPPAGSA